MIALKELERETRGERDREGDRERGRERGREAGREREREAVDRHHSLAHTHTVFIRDSLEIMLRSLYYLCATMKSTPACVRLN